MYRIPPRTRWVAVLVVAGAICYFSVFTTPDPGVTPMGPLGLVGADKWYHAVGYGGLGAVLAFALAGRHAHSQSRGGQAQGTRARTCVRVTGERRAGVLAIAGATGYGVAMELVQWPIPLRHASVGDVVADALGATVAVAVWWALSRAGGRARRDEADLRA
ncbi:VanZ family protein [Haladaptatus sp. NG-SE-30]